MSGLKKEIQAMLDRLPEDCTLEDIQYRLYVMQKVRKSFEAIDCGQGIEHEQAIKRLGK